MYVAHYCSSSNILFLGRSYYISTDSIYTEFIRHILEVLHHSYVCKQYFIQGHGLCGCDAVKWRSRTPIFQWTMLPPPAGWSDWDLAVDRYRKSHVLANRK